jgi:hypothetical protein
LIKHSLIFCVGFSLLLIASKNLKAQNKRSVFSDTLKSVTIDSNLTITAKRGLSMNDFVQVMLNDTAFYEAFRNLRKFSFVATNKIETFNDDNLSTAKIYRKINHDNSTRNYKQTILSASDSGKIFKRNGDFNLYTVKMFSYIFMNDRNTDFTQVKSYTKNESDEETYKQKLKTLIFNPGKKVDGIPLISDKTEIFGKELKKYYDFTFYYATYQDSVPVYYFKCKVKEGLTWWREDDTMIKELTTIFNAKDFTILGRYIDMQYSSAPFDFNVKMNIELAYATEDLLVPVHISYDGDWDIPFKKKEICTFDIYHTNFKKGLILKQ